jgi:hypothetical protein
LVERDEIALRLVRTRFDTSIAILQGRVQAGSKMASAHGKTNSFGNGTRTLACGQEYKDQKIDVWLTRRVIVN